MARPQQEWSAAHAGLDPATIPFVLPWLRLMWWLARPLAARRLPAAALTGAGVALAVAAALLARSLPRVAGALVLLAVLADGLDGAVALLAGTASAAGARLDRTADRISDLAFAAVLWRCGAPLWLAAAAGVATLVPELARERWPGLRARLTVAERPSRAVCAVLTCGCAALDAPGWTRVVCAAVWLGLGLLSWLQLALPRRSPARASAAGRGDAGGASRR